MGQQRPLHSPRRGMRPENRVTIAIGIVTLVAGIAVLAIGGGDTGATIAAAMLLGVAGIAAVSLIFLLVGQSEEDDRERHPRG